MINSFIELVKRAQENNWCTKPYCTTCGSTEYRNRLQKLGGETGGELIDSLSELEPNDLTGLENWRGALFIAFIDLPLYSYADIIIDSWLPKVKGNVVFADFVLFKIIKPLPPKSKARNQWIGMCLKLALKENNFSLIESLILVLGESASDYPELIELGKKFAKSSSQMRRVLRNTSND